ATSVSVRLSRKSAGLEGLQGGSGQEQRVMSLCMPGREQANGRGEDGFVARLPRRRQQYEPPPPDSSRRAANDRDGRRFARGDRDGQDLLHREVSKRHFKTRDAVEAERPQR